MKTLKKIVCASLIAFFGIIAFSLVSCGGDDNNDPVQIGTVGGIPVYRTADVSVADGEAVLAIITTVYGFLDGSPTDQATFAEKVTAIHIVSGNTASLNGTILEVGDGADMDTVADCVLGFLYG